MAIELAQLRKLSDLDKVEAAPPSVLGAPTDPVTAIIRVAEPLYVPHHVQVRARVSPLIFTAQFPADALEEIEADEKVESISLSRPLRMIE